MNIKEPYLFDAIDFNKIRFTKIIQKKTKKIIYLKYKNGNVFDNLVTQTPTLWSIKTPTKLGNNLYDLEIPLIGKRKNNTDKFTSFLKKLDLFIIESAKNNASSWFNSTDQAVYLNSIRESNEDNIKSGFIKLKIVRSIDFKTVLKKDNKYKIKISDIKPNSWVKSIIQIFAIWVKPNNQFGVYFKPIIISFKEPKKNLLSYNFVKETEEEEEDEFLDTPANPKTNDIFLKPEEFKNHSDNMTSILKIDTNTFDDNSTSSEEVQNNISTNN